MSVEKDPGWYYTAQGRLRYHDEKGWTEHYLDPKEVPPNEWPIPPPLSMLDQVRAQQALEADAGRARSPWWRRTRGRR